ncbi:MAG: NADH-quinone oxidoreductase subunit L, partial [Vampirovibrionales bacterium]
VYALVSFLLIFILRNFPLPAWRVAKTDGWFQKEPAFYLTALSSFLGILHAVAAVSYLFQGKLEHPIQHNVTWLSIAVPQLMGVATPAQLPHIAMGYQLDALSVMMLFVVTFISFWIHIFTHGYMKHDKGYAKFFSFLSLFNFAMLGLVLSTNLVQSFVFWELVGVCSYLLIGFWVNKSDAGPASFKAFMVNKVGDFGFLLGMLLLMFVSFIGSQQVHVGFGDAFLGFDSLPFLAQGFSKTLAPVMTLATLLLFLGPVAKSAQWPLHTWLPDAMAGPTPISALIHAATMVAAGVYLIARIYPLVEAYPLVKDVILLIGLITAFVGATIALTQYDIKKALAYSTMSQLGFMVTAMGCGAFTAGLFHLFTHAFFKAMLFLGSGSVIHAVEDEQDMRKMGGLFKKLPVTATTYLLGTIAISGLGWTSGFWSKDEILLGLSNASQHFVIPGLEKLTYSNLFPVLALIAGLTAFYMFRTFFLTFTGTYRGKAHVHHEDKVLTTPLVVLAVPSVFIGLVLSGVFHQFPSFAHYISPEYLFPVGKALSHGATTHHGHAPSFFSEVGNLSQLIGLTGLALAFAFYGPVRLFSAEFFRTLPPFSWLDALFRRKWFCDEIQEHFWVKGFFTFIFQGLAWFDKYVIDGFVNLLGYVLTQGGGALKRLQFGSIQVALGIAVLGVVYLSWLMLQH